MPKKPILIFAASIFLSYFAYGIYSYHRLGWFEPGLAQERLIGMVSTAAEIALMASVAAALAAWTLRNRFVFRQSGALVALGVLCSVILIGALSLALEIRGAIAKEFFPYVIWFRFGMGLHLIWVPISFAVCGAVIMATALARDALRHRRTS